MSTERATHNAAASYRGYGLQTVRLCVRLLTEPRDATCYVEHEDDVSVRYGNGIRLLEQVKNTKANPLTDWSVDFWKTIHNWLNDHGPIASSDIRQLCIYATPVHAPGTFAAALLKADTADDVAALVKDIRKGLNATRKKSNVYPYLKRFLDAPIDEQLALAKRFQLIIESDPFAAIGALYAISVSEPVLERVVKYALGACKRITDGRLHGGALGSLKAGELQDEVRTFLQTINLPALFSFDLPSPTDAEVAKIHAAKPVFIRQLELIEADQRQQLNAANDYLRAAASKTQWSVDGILLPGSLDEWESTLESRHSAICDGCEAAYAHLNEVQRGKLVYAKCRLVEVELQGKTVPDHFTHGCFNELSNDRKLGWHPNFTDLLD